MVSCLVCSASDLSLVLDLGETALANNFLTEDELSNQEPMYPLRLARCSRCAHVQLLDRVDPSDMFDTYLYVSSMSETLKNHLRNVADTAAQFVHAQPEDLALDIGSNDGTLLTGYDAYGLRTLGVDPAQNLAELARQNGIATVTEYFGERVAKEIRAEYGQANIITATNSFPHIPRLDDYMRGVAAMLHKKGVFLTEANYAGAMAADVAFDTIYHEHVSYWLLEPMHRLFDKYELEIFVLEHLPIHHGQIRVFVCHKGTKTPDQSVAKAMDEERSKGLLDGEAWQTFAHRTRTLKSDLHQALSDFRSQSKSVAGYGAPAKASTLLGFLGLGSDDIPYIADRSPLKQGRYTPGTHIPIVDPRRIIDERPDYLIIFAWNFADEIMDQLSDYGKAGGRFVIPVPTVEVIS